MSIREDMPLLARYEGLWEGTCACYKAAGGQIDETRAENGETGCRTWHWIRNGDLETRTAIEERRISHDWRTIEAGMEAAFG